MSDGFERGAGVTMLVSYGLLSSFLVLAAFLVVLVVIVGAYGAWSKGDINLSSLQNVVIRSLVFFVVVVVLMGL